MKIDAHQHFWQYDPQLYSWITDDKIKRNFTAPDLEVALFNHGFTGCISVQADQSEAETERLLALAGSHDFIKGVVGWVDLDSESVGERLEHFCENSYLKGIRHTVWDKEGEFMGTPGFRRGIAALASFDLAFDLLAFDYQLDSAIDLVKAFPGQRFVLDHLGKPRMAAGVDLLWEKHIVELGSCSNVYCKISGMVSQTGGKKWIPGQFDPFLEVVTEAFDTNRLMFGSDWPVSLSAATYAEVVGIVEDYFSGYSKEDKDKIFGNNATRFYNLNL